MSLTIFHGSKPLKKRSFDHLVSVKRKKINAVPESESHE